MAFLNGVDLPSHELLPAQGLIWNHLLNFINSFSLKCAIQLGIPDIIHKYGKPMPLSELVYSLPIPKEKIQCLQRLMRLMIHSGFFLETPEGYVLTQAAHLLLKENPLSVTPFLLSMLDPAITAPWNQLSSWFKIDHNSDTATPFEAHHGRPFWDLAGQDPQFNNHFNEGMASDAKLLSTLVIEKCKDVFEGMNSIVDVGGGTGTMAKAIADAFPGLSCTVLDLPHVVDGLQGSRNLSFVAGDMFDSVPPADATLLKWILNSWSDERCIKILKKCKEAVQCKKNNGKVIIIDMVLVDGQKEDNNFETRLFFDMLMMVLVNGKERTEKDWATLFKEVGFKSYKVTPMFGLRSLIEAYP